MNTENDSGRESVTSLIDRLLTLPQYLIPQHILSRGMHALTRSEIRWFKNAFIKFICWKFNVNFEEAASQALSDYPSFNAFFTRQLKAGVHEIDAEHPVVSPVDGAISQIGSISQGYIVQAKGRTYSIHELLGEDAELTQQFSGGQFATIYLSPRDYHRIHMPLTGQLSAMRYIPGKLFSVNPRTARTVPNLFARNERIVTVYETEFGPMALVLVGAIFVGSMETVWAGQITPPYRKAIQYWDYDESAPTFDKGEEMGRFNMGSTVVVLLPPAAPKWLSSLAPEQGIRLGQAMAK